MSFPPVMNSGRTQSVTCQHRRRTAAVPTTHHIGTEFILAGDVPRTCSYTRANPGRFAMNSGRRTAHARAGRTPITSVEPAGCGRAPDRQPPQHPHRIPRPSRGARRSGRDNRTKHGFHAIFPAKGVRQSRVQPLKRLQRPQVPFRPETAAPAATVGNRSTSPTTPTADWYSSAIAKPTNMYDR